MRAIKKALKELVNAFLSPLQIEIRSVFSGGRLFAESFSHLKKVLPAVTEKAQTVIDIGVADGTPELWSAFPASEYKYLLVEANPAYAEKLEGFGKSMNAVIEKVFCGENDGTETFITDPTYNPRKASKYSRKTGGEEERTLIPSNKIDTILKRHALPIPYILKIDVEGAELSVLKGAAETLENAEAVIVETPVSLRSAEISSFGEIVSFMHADGFAVFDISEMSYHSKSGFLNLANVIFVKKDNVLWNKM